MSATAHIEPLRLQDLRAGDLADAGAMVREAGWNQLPADWLVFLELGTVYAVRGQAERVIATAATLPYADRIAWISMVLVASDYRRRGLATRMLRRCVDDLSSRGLTPALDATPAGREVYARLGFQDGWGFQRYSAPVPRRAGSTSHAPQGVTIRRVGADDWPELSRFDAQCFGADRSPLLKRLLGRAPHVQFAAWRAGRIVGFSLGRDGQSATHLGPVAADDETTALALLTRAIGDSQGPLFIDALDDKRALRRWLEGCGFAPQRRFTRMAHGRTLRIGDVARTMAVAGPEFG